VMLVLLVVDRGETAKPGARVCAASRLSGTIARLGGAMWRVVLALGACGPIRIEDGPDSEPEAAIRPPDRTSAPGLTWKSVGAPFVRRGASRCPQRRREGRRPERCAEQRELRHARPRRGAGGAIDFVLDGKGPAMPPKGEPAPSAKEVEGRFLLWLDCGAPK
jgi:hypothetical protein